MSWVHRQQGDGVYLLSFGSVFSSTFFNVALKNSSVSCSGPTKCIWQKNSWPIPSGLLDKLWVTEQRCWYVPGNSTYSFPFYLVSLCWTQRFGFLAYLLLLYPCFAWDHVRRGSNTVFLMTRPLFFHFCVIFHNLDILTVCLSGFLILQNFESICCWKINQSMPLKSHCICYYLHMW